MNIKIKKLKTPSIPVDEDNYYEKFMYILVLYFCVELYNFLNSF